MAFFDPLARTTRMHAGPLLYALGNVASSEYVQAFAETEWLSRAPAEKVQEASRQKLHRYLRYCQTYSRFWRERWPSRWERFAEEESEAVLADLPTLTKQDLRAHEDALRIRACDRGPRDGFPATPGQLVNFSGGTTGEPTKVWQDERFAARNRAVIDHAYRSVGLIPGRSTYYLWGSNNELKDIEASRRKQLATWLRGLVALPSFTLGSAQVRTYVDRINSEPSVDQALCFVNALDAFTQIVEREQLSVRRLRRVVTGGGKLHDAVRVRTRRVLSDDVFEIYGGRDVGMLGVESPDHRGLLTYPWHNHIQVLHDGRAVREGESGEIHVTCVQNYSTALVKLRLGDVARLRPPGVSENRPGISTVTGRTVEHLVGPNGVTIEPLMVVHLIGVLEERPWIKRFQLVQTSPLAATLRLETWSQPSEVERQEHRLRLTQALSRVFDAPFNLTVELVPEIAPTASGKHLYVVGWTPPA